MTITGDYTSEQGLWSALDGFLDPATCDEIGAACERFEEEPARISGPGAASNVRVCSVRRVRRRPDTEWVYALAWDLGTLLNDHNFELALSGIDKEVEYVRYGSEGGRFEWHNDLGLERPISRRKLTLSIQLSDPADYVGGDFEVHGCARPLCRSRGSVLVLPSYVHHRVTPVTAGVRRALLVWLAGPTLR